MPIILIVEDETLLAEEVSDWLRFEGYDVLVATNGKQGVALASSQQPDLILCDVTMPQLDGYAVLTAIRANQQTAGTPFIFITAHSTHEDLRRGMDSGADDYITKPFTREELLRAVAARLRAKDQQREEYRQEMQLLQKAFVQLHNQHLLQAKLLSMLSHDFNGPLTSILLTTTLLQAHDHKIDTAARLQHFDRIIASTRLLQQMLEDVLLVTQIEKGELILRPQQVIPQEFLEQIVQVLKAAHGDKYQMKLDYQPNKPLMVDPRLLRQIAVNLIANAMKYSSSGSTVQVALFGEDDSIVLRVEDQGIGIPQAELQGIYDAFQRCSNVGSISGSGLGLAIVKQAVDLYDGTITLDSEIGVGTTVTVKLPVIVKATAVSGVCVGKKQTGLGSYGLPNTIE